MNGCSVPMCGESGLCDECRRKLRSAVKHPFPTAIRSEPPDGTTTRCPICGDVFTPNFGTLATCRRGCVATPEIVTKFTKPESNPEPHHGPHERALVLSVADRQELQNFVRGGGYELLRKIANGGPRALAINSPTESQKVAMGFVELLLKIAKRVLLFQSHAEEAVIAYDHREQSIANLRFRAEGPASEFLVNELCKAWYAAGGRLEAIENGVDTVDLDWRRDVWRIVAEVAQQTTQPLGMDRQCVEAALKFAINEHELRRMIYDEEIAWRTMSAMLQNALNAPAKPSVSVVLSANTPGRSKPTMPITATCAKCVAGKVGTSTGWAGADCQQCGGRGTVEVFL